MLTKVMAKALAPDIAVNCVAPGMIDLGEKAAATFMKRMAKQTPMRRNGTGEEIAEAVFFFASAPHFITGQILVVDGTEPLISGLMLLSGGWINNSFDFGNPVRREAALFSVLPHHFFVRSNVDTVNLVLGHITLQPLNLRAEVLENSTGFL